MNNKRLILCAVSILLAAAMTLTACGGADNNKTPDSSEGASIQSGAPNNSQGGTGDSSVGHSIDGSGGDSSSNTGGEQSNGQEGTQSGANSGEQSKTEVSVDPEQVVESSVLTIENGGEYTIDKEVSGTVVINTKEALTLTLKNATIKSDNGPAIYVLNCKDLVIKSEGNNTLSDGATYTEPYAGAKGAFFSEDDVVFSGDGSLTVSSACAHAIVCDDGIVIEGSAIKVTSAVKDAVHANDAVKIKGGSLTVQQASGDGIHSETAVEISGGKVDITSVGDGIKAAANSTTEGSLVSYNVSVSGGTVKINTEEDGLQADTTLTISGGNINVTTTGAVSNNNSQGGMFPGGGGTFPGGGMTPPDGGGGRPGRGERPASTDSTGITTISSVSTTTTTTTESDSSKGLKAGVSLVISGGTINVNSTDDAVHSNGSIEIHGGSTTVKTNDDAVHADGAVVINDGTVTVTGCYEGIEGMSIEVNGGMISVTASDDGFNASDGSSSENRPGQANSANSIVINGGYVYVNSNGDGVDSNGALTINGGTVLVDGPNGGGNSPIDADGTRLVNGGMLIAAGGSDMLENPHTSSKQNCAVIYAGNLAANTTVALKNSKGETIFCYTLSKAASTLTISLPELETGESYTLYTGVKPINTVLKLLYGDEAGFTGGTAAKTFRQSSTVTQAR